MSRKPPSGRKPLSARERERLEEELDLRLAKKARNEKTIPWEKVKKELGL